MKEENGFHSNKHQWKESERKVRQGQKVEQTVKFNTIPPPKERSCPQKHAKSDIKAFFFSFLFRKSTPKLKYLSSPVSQITTTHLHCNQCLIQASSLLKTKMQDI